MPYPRIVEEFLELVRIPTHSYKERAIAEVLKNKLLSLGCHVEEDTAGAAINGEANNLIARWPGRQDREPILFSAHMDRVSNPGQINSVVNLNDDRITSDGQTILAADDISGLVSILEGLRLIEAEGTEHGDVEIVFSVAEEVGLQGARQLDATRIKSQYGYILDSSGSVGTIVNRAPTQKTVTVKIHGLSSHAGMAPEKGINAIMAGAIALSKIKEGRLSPITTSNFGVIHGGKATNIVCDYLVIKGEARSHNEDELADYITHVNEIFTNTILEFGARVEISWDLEYSSFYVKEDDPVITLADKAFKNLGLKTQIITGGGGMDGNIYNEKGIKSVGLSTGYQNVHTEKEEQSISQLILCSRAVAEIIKAAPPK
ncbi:MAG: M20/M25/M40 family metallo-hydrolase [Deltaproteobacteria bacterium]|jgi:tripeptide aminopeptidase|nr:M20/M25/M40 family metallo-hydrolase [Deltaproteobacteria bacterium]